ncbi:MAG TPA: PilZ domain-containing protein [Terriglobales bacterium]|nr:PilZ domain-containing protein [Terriglobales bacterium]
MDGSEQKERAASQAPRRFPRYQVDIRVSLQVFRPSGTVSFWGRSTELGEDGIGATLTGEVEPGEVVSMELSLPAASHPMKFRALVRYRTGLRHGFEFLALNSQQKGALRRLCEMLTSGT